MEELFEAADKARWRTILTKCFVGVAQDTACGVAVVVGVLDSLSGLRVGCSMRGGERHATKGEMRTKGKIES
jgi:hypothetical protein